MLQSASIQMSQFRMSADSRRNFRSIRDQKKPKKVGKQETAKIVKQGWSPIPADILVDS